MEWYPCTCGAEHDTPECPFGYNSVPAPKCERCGELPHPDYFPYCSAACEQGTEE